MRRLRARPATWQPCRSVAPTQRRTGAEAVSCTIQMVVRPESSQVVGFDDFDCQGELFALIDALVDVIFCAKDLCGRYVEVNTAFVRRTGAASKRQVIGTRAQDHFNADLAERYERQDAQVFASARPLRNELELIRRPTGSHGWYVTTKLPVAHRETGELVGLVSISRDLVVPEEAEMADLRRVIQFVRDHLAEKIRVADLAAIIDVSPEQLSRRMKQVSGLTPIQFVQRARIDRAAHLLTNSDEQIAAIGAACGFYDQSDFTRRFGQYTNSTPAQFRLASRA